MEWNRKQLNQKTWVALKVHFRLARKEIKETSGSTIGSSQLNDTANLVQQVVEGVQRAFLPTDGAPDPTSDILQQVVNSASANTATQQQLLQQIANLQQTVTQMQFQLNASHQQPPFIDQSGRSGGNASHQQPPFIDHSGRSGGRTRGGGYQGRGRGGGRGPIRYPRRYNVYFWSHGGCGHHGATCRDKKPGHQDTATFEVKIKGSTANCPPGNVSPAAGWTPPNV